ncbi:MAG: hypothetical protein CMM55_05480 [Rhodospirillaceae bacterium]|nr:hypothetical protein [Rhodospirillaceae bacterium]
MRRNLRKKFGDRFHGVLVSIPNSLGKRYEPPDPPREHTRSLRPLGRVIRIVLIEFGLTNHRQKRLIVTIILGRLSDDD